jgi:hypothetical protein
MKRPKKPSLDSIREKKFSKQLEGLRHLPNSGIIKRIDSRLFSLDGNTVFNYKPELLAAEEYKRCLELFERRLPNEHVLPTMEAMAHISLRMSMYNNAIAVKELKHYDELTSIAEGTIRDLFEIPEHVRILPEINTSLDVNPEDQDDSPDSYLSLSLEEKREMHDEIQKRIILNGLVHGSAMHIWKSAHYIIKEKVDRLDPSLMMLYDQYTAAIGWLIWQTSPDNFQDMIGRGDAITQGFNKLEFEEEGEPECNVLCHAVNFPVLLHEITKGVMDYLICHGIPTGYSEEQLKYYYAKADAYENELYHYLLSPTLWLKLNQATGVHTQDIPMIISKLSTLPYHELADVLRACVDGEKEGNLKLRVKKIV